MFMYILLLHVSSFHEFPPPLSPSPSFLSSFFLQKRYQMLDNSAQRQKAALGHGKGLVDRRLPSQYAGKVSEDYHSRRKAYNPLAAVRNQEGVSRSTEDLTTVSREEKEKEVSATLCSLLIVYVSFPPPDINEGRSSSVQSASWSSSVLQEGAQTHSQCKQGEGCSSHD